MIIPEEWDKDFVFYSYRFTKFSTMTVTFRTRKRMYFSEKISGDLEVSVG